MTTKRRPTPTAPKAAADAPLTPGAQIVREALGLIMLFLGAFLLLTLLSHNPEDPSFNYASDNAAVHNLAGRTGALLSDGLYQALGYGAFWLVFFLLVPGYRLLRSKPEEIFYLDRVMAAPMVALVTMTLHALLTHTSSSPDAFPPAGPGGVIGGAMAETMRHAFGLWGGLLLITPLGVLALMVLLRVSFTGIMEWVRDLREVSLPKPTSIPEARQMVSRSGADLFSKAVGLSGKLLIGIVGVVAALPMLMHALHDRLRAATPKARPTPPSPTAQPLGAPLLETRVEPVIDLPPTPAPELRDLLAKTALAAPESAPVIPAPVPEPALCGQAATPEAARSAEAPVRAPEIAAPPSEPITSASLFTGQRPEPTVAPMAPIRQESLQPAPPAEVAARGAPGLSIEKATLALSLGGSATPGLSIEQPRISFSLGSAPVTPARDAQPDQADAKNADAAPARRQGVVFLKKSPEAGTSGSEPEMTAPGQPDSGSGERTDGSSNVSRLRPEPVELDPDEELPPDEGIPPLAPWSRASDNGMGFDGPGETIPDTRMPSPELSFADATLETYADPDLESDDTSDDACFNASSSLEDAPTPLPPLSLLALPEDTGYHGPSREELQSTARLLEQKLEDFKVKGQIIDAHPGPVITTYELDPAPGLRAAKVIGLADDLARSISAVSVRVVGNIPGKNVIGIEIPNANRRTVYLREILDSDIFRQVKSPLAMALGSDINGRPVVGNLAKMPHLLVAGTTGSGKSVAVNAMICSILFSCRPEDVRFLMVDPKMLELSIYEGIPHLLAPVVTDVNKAAALLKWAVAEMEERYRLMSELGVRNLSGYNQRIQECLISGEEPTRRVKVGFDPETGRPVEQEEPIPLEKKPLIVIIIDELADLMIQVGKDVEPAIARLAQMARAAGLHLIIATQRPSVDVITGLIKANFPTRLAFQVSSKIDSRTILDSMGADRLLGMGDGLFQPPGTGLLQRIHAPFVADGEVHTLVKFLKSTGRPEYDLSILAHGTGGDEGDDMGMGDGMTDEYDPLYDQAVAVVIRARKVSTSMVQRHFKIGYNRAARIVDRMAMDGLISEPNHSGKREVLAPNQGGER